MRVPLLFVSMNENLLNDSVDVDDDAFDDELFTYADTLLCFFCTVCIYLFK